MPAFARDPARAARTILRALETADLPALEDALGRSADLLPPIPPYPDLESERWELLQAVSQALRDGIRRMRRGLGCRLDGLGACLALLAHLARTPPVAMDRRTG